MASWTAKRRIRDLIIVCVIAGVGYYLWVQRQARQGGEDESMTCKEELAEVLAKCQPACEDTGPVKAVRSTSVSGTSEECLENCSLKYFHKQLPRC
jgi:hypothetical protein